MDEKCIIMFITEDSRLMGISHLHRFQYRLRNGRLAYILTESEVLLLHNLPGAEDIVHTKVDYARIRKEEIDSRIVLPLVLYAVPKYHKFVCENFVQF